MDLGRYPETSLGEARERHRTARMILDRGENPITVRAAEESAQKAMISIDDLIKQFVTLELARTRKKPEDAFKILDANIAPTLGRKPAKSISRNEIVGVLDAIARRGSPVMANRTCSLVNRCFDSGLYEDI